MADEPVRVAVYFEDDSERQVAEDRLQEAETFANVVEGVATPDGLVDMSASGLVVEVLPQSIPELPVVPLPSMQAVPEEKILDLADQANLTPRPDRPSAAEALEDDVYRIQLSGPITREQRLEFWDLGVDIAAFEPPDRYRTFLTREQYARVNDLPYVVDVARYGFHATLTPELVKLLEEEAAPGAGLATAGPDAEPRVFECLLHREKDKEAIRAVISDAEGTEIVGTSNLRIRFTAPADLSFLVQLAARPQVAKLAPFDPPEQ